MSRGRRILNLVSDFETTTTPDDCRVWGWGLCEIGENPTVEFGQNISQFLTRVSRINSRVYFHNLKWDGKFILDFIMKRDFTLGFGELKRGQFSTLISGMGQFYTITVKWLNGKKTEFRDSLKKLPMTVRRIGESFGLDVLKGDIDYHSHRPVGHVLTDEEKLYIKNDVLIVAKALNIQHEAGLTRLTVGSDALQEFKVLTGKKSFERMFPVFPLSIDDDVRLAYRGGFTYVKRDRQKILQGGGSVFDVNSLYPYVMKEKKLPYGEPIFFSGDPRNAPHDLFIVSITFMAKLKPDHIPCIQIKGSSRFSETEYLEEINEPTTLMTTNVDLALWSDHYDLDILAYNGGWSFKSATGVFNKYIEKWGKIKEESAGGMRELAKLQLNSLYGKFATNPDITSKVPVLKDGMVKLVDGKPEFRDPVYTPMGVFITAHARNHTIRAAQKHYCCFLYADTDSLHLASCEFHVKPDLDVDPKRLGAWAHEYDFSKAMFWRAKQYSELRADGEMETHIAGMPVEVQKTVRFEDYVLDKVFYGKLKQKTVPGGAVLVEDTFTLRG